MRPGVVVGFVVLLALPVGAQDPGLGPALEIDDAVRPDPIEPDTGIQQVVFPHRILCDWNRALLVANSPVQVQHEFQSAHAGVIITGELTRAVPTEDCAVATTASIDVDAAFDVQVTSDAPGEQPLDFTLRSRVLTDRGPSASVEAHGTVQAAYLARLAANVPTTIKQTVGGSATYDVVLTNLGNSRTTVGLTVDAGQGAKVTLPSPIVLESAAQGGTDTEKTVPIEVRYSGGKEATLRLTMVPASTKDPALTGEPVTIHLLVRDASFLGRVAPDASPLLPIGLVALAVAARRVSKEGDG